MCLIIAKPEGQEIEERVIRDAAISNNNGFGLMYSLGSGYMGVHKILPKTSQDAVDLYKQHSNKNLGIHFRMRTHGNVDLAQCHPYQVLKRNKHGRDMWLMHNGVFRAVPEYDKTKSDTWHFVEYFFRPAAEADPERVFEPAFVRALSDMVGYNKMLVMDGFGHMAIYNKQAGQDSEGCWFSNYNTYKKSTYTYTGPNMHTNLGGTRHVFHANKSEEQLRDSEQSLMSGMEKTEGSTTTSSESSIIGTVPTISRNSLEERDNLDTMRVIFKSGKKRPFCLPYAPGSQRYDNWTPSMQKAAGIRAAELEFFVKSLDNEELMELLTISAANYFAYEEWMGEDVKSSSLSGMQMINDVTKASAMKGDMDRLVNWTKNTAKYIHGQQNELEMKDLLDKKMNLASMYLWALIKPQDTARFLRDNRPDEKCQHCSDDKLPISNVWFPKAGNHYGVMTCMAKEAVASGFMGLYKYLGRIILMSQLGEMLIINNERGPAIFTTKASGEWPLPWAATLSNKAMVNEFTVMASNSRVIGQRLSPSLVNMLEVESKVSIVRRMSPLSEEN